MMKMKVDEAEREVLNWLVAQAEGQDAVISGGDVCSFKTVAFREYKFVWEPSTNWAQGGPIIERAQINLSCLVDNTVWEAWPNTGMNDDFYCQGPTPLIAAMRCYVVSKLGSEVDVPDELVNHNIP